jgi:hypothetical protein
MFYTIISSFEGLFPVNAQVLGRFCVFSHSTNHLAGGVPFAVPNNPLSSLRQRVGECRRHSEVQKT